MKIFEISAATVIIVLFAVIDGRQNNGRKRGRAKYGGKNAGSKRGENNQIIQSLSYTNAFLQAVDSNDEDIPIFCSEDELSRAIRRCVLIWKNYCKCEHCSYCSEKEWPPDETQDWVSRRADISWKDLEEAWKWAGKCAYNKTKLWRISCKELQGLGMITDEKTGERKEYEYWFLVNLKNKTNQSVVQELCLKKECPYLLTAQEYEVQKTPEKKITETSKVTASPAEDDENKFYEMKVLECKEKELNMMMQKCMLIWKEYCRCAGCRDVPACEKNEWPPRQTSKWSTRKVTKDLKTLENAWKWVGECAYNATTGWRDWCYIRSPGSDDQDQPEPEYWFLTELDADTHPKMIQGLCETSECHKFKETSRVTTPMPTSAKTTLLMQESSTGPHTITTKRPTTVEEKTTINLTETSSTKSQQSSVSVPKWAYIIIAVLGLIVIVMIALLVLFLYYRAKTKRRNSQQTKFERRGTTSTVTSAPWQHQTSFTFFGEQPLPGVEDSIYHTIRDAQPSPLPVSPTFLPSFSTHTFSFQEPKSESRSNVLYHDTIPRYQNSYIQRGGDSSQNQVHTYEDTRPFSPPPVLPYFIPTGAEQMNEYGTLEEPSRLEGTSRETSASQRRRNQQQNYDHIELI